MDTKTISGAIVEIMREVSPISKARKNTQQNYNFRGVDDAMDMLSPLLAKHGVFPTTENIEDIINDTVVSKNGGAGYRTVRRYTFRFFAVDGSSVSTQTDGEAIDYGDKASNKAYSVAYREALWKLFVVPFTGNEDTEEASHDLKPQNEPTVQYATKPTAKATVAPKKTHFEMVVEMIQKATTAEELADLAEKVTNSPKYTDEQKADLQDSIEARASLI